MKLGKLLAAGKSIMNGHTEVSYRSSKQIYLPKFGSTKNPFKPGAPDQADEATPLPAPAAVTEPHTTPGGPTRLAPSDEPAPQSAAPRGHEDCPYPEPGRAELPVGRTPGGSATCEGASLPGSGVQSAKVSGTDAAQSVKKPTNCLSNGQSMAAAVQTTNPLQRFNGIISIIRAALLRRKARRTENTAKGHKGTPTQTELSLDTVKVVHNDLSDVDVEVVPIKSRAGVPDLPAPKKSWEFVGERLFGVEAT
jgi:hypothetical protein